MARLATWILERRNEAIVVVAVATFLSIMGPGEGPRTLSWPVAWAYWLALVGLGWLVGRTTAALTTRLLGDPPVWVVFVFAPLIVSVAVTAAIMMVEAAFGSPIPLSFAPNLYGVVWVVSLAITGVAYLTERAFGRADGDGDAGATPEAGPAGAAFRDRLPARLRTARVLAVASEDHYLRVYTDAGDAMILMRLSDAVRELAGLEGMQTHRSWWVARAAIADVARANGRMTLTLTNGIDAPVSRTYAKALREAGWV